MFWRLYGCQGRGHLNCQWTGINGGCREARSRLPRCRAMCPLIACPSPVARQAVCMHRMPCACPGRPMKIICPRLVVAVIWCAGALLTPDASGQRTPLRSNALLPSLDPSIPQGTPAGTSDARCQLAQSWSVHPPEPPLSGLPVSLSHKTVTHTLSPCMQLPPPLSLILTRPSPAHHSPPPRLPVTIHSVSLGGQRASLLTRLVSGSQQFGPLG